MAGGLRVNPTWPAWYDAEAEKVVHRVTAGVHRDAVGNCPKGRTRSLSRSIRPVYLRMRGQVWVGGPGLAYWFQQEYGAAPHIIRAKVKRALWWAGARHPVRSVRHPGNKALAFMRRALYQRRELGGRL